MTTKQEALDFLTSFNFSKTKLIYPGPYTTQIYYSKVIYIRIDFGRGIVSMFYRLDHVLKCRFKLSDNELEFLKLKIS